MKTKEEEIYYCPKCGREVEVPEHVQADFVVCYWCKPPQAILRSELLNERPKKK